VRQATREGASNSLRSARTICRRGDLIRRMSGEILFPRRSTRARPTPRLRRSFDSMAASARARTNDAAAGEAFISPHGNSGVRGQPPASGVLISTRWQRDVAAVATAIKTDVDARSPLSCTKGLATSPKLHSGTRRSEGRFGDRWPVCRDWGHGTAEGRRRCAVTRQISSTFTDDCDAVKGIQRK
jgi:hypothetical protein